MTEDYLYGTWWGGRVAGTTLIHETRLLTPHERDRLIGRRLERDADANPGHPYRFTRDVCADCHDVGGPCWGHGLGLVLIPEAVPA